MVSLDDFLEVFLEKMEGLGLGMKLREFDTSRVKVLQEVGLDVSITANMKLMDYMEIK